MKKILSILLILIIFKLNAITVNNEEIIKISLKFLELLYDQHLTNYIKNENIKEIKITTYNTTPYIDEKLIEIKSKFDNNFNEIERVHWDAIVGEPIIYTAKYDDKNNITNKKTEYKGTTNYQEGFYIDNINTEESYIYTYNEKEKIIKIKYNRRKYGNHNYGYDYGFRYNENSKLVEIIEYSYDGSPNKTKIFNEKELLVKEIDKSLGKEHFEKTYDYDQNNNLIEYYTELFRSNKKIKDLKKYTYEYDNNNSLIKESRFFNNNLLLTINYEYDDNNYLINVNEYKNGKTMSKIMKYIYTTDKNNKIIKVEQEYIDVISYKLKYNLIHEIEYIYK